MKYVNMGSKMIILIKLSGQYALESLDMNQMWQQMKKKIWSSKIFFVFWGKFSV